MYKQATTKGQPMVKTIKKEERKFCNVALLPEDHDKLKRLADDEQRTMTRQLSDFGDPCGSSGFEVRAEGPSYIEV
jgi:hypothetical protein